MPVPSLGRDEGPTIVVIDRRPLVRHGLVAIAEEAGVGAVHAVAAVPAAPVPWVAPLIVLLGLAGGDDAAALVSDARERLGAPVACALFCDEPALIARALAAEADGYLINELADSDAIVDLVIAAQAGKRTLPPELVLPRRRRGGNSILSERCLQVLRCLAAGQHDHEIAEHLEISTSSVRKHVRIAEERMRARTRPEALAMAIRAGIL